MGILSLWESGKIQLIGSEILRWEASKITQPERFAYAQELMNRLENEILVEGDIEKRGTEFAERGLKPVDALHLGTWNQ